MSRLLEDSRSKNLDLEAQLLQSRQQCIEQEEETERIRVSCDSRLARLRTLVQVRAFVNIQ